MSFFSRFSPFLLAVSFLALLPGRLAGQPHPLDYPIDAIPFTEVQFDGGLLGNRVRTVLDSTITFAFRKCEESGRIGNFAKAVGLMEGPHIGLRYDDSDVFKVIEGASYALATDYDPAMDGYLDSLITLIGSAQEDDGYLYTARTAGGSKDRRIGKYRWSDIEESHELYNMGHLYEAAVAHYKATGKCSLLDIALKNADFIYDTFFATSTPIVPGHEEIELALVKLYQLTGQKKYLDLSRYLLDCRGVHGRKETYRQSHIPVTEQTKAVGHAVRAVYLYMAMTDIAGICKDPLYCAAVDSLWEDVTGTKMYITGGVGARAKGESFGESYELPNESAYCETCAAIAYCMWNYRMFRLTGDAKFMDIFERAMYNNVLDGISADGMTFYYPNRLEFNPDNIIRPGSESLPKGPVSRRFPLRQPWFRTSCCPGNLARFIPSIPGYVYAASGDSLYVNLYAQGNLSTVLENGKKVRLSQRTAYPWDGKVDIHIEKAPRGKITLLLRIPSWCLGKPAPGDLYTYTAPAPAKPLLKVNGASIPVDVINGYAVLRRHWKKGDRISLDLPMSPMFVEASNHVEADRGKLAVERGPIVYCVEKMDSEELDIRKERISRDETLTVSYARSPYGEIPVLDSRNLHLIPWFIHALSGPAQMQVFIRKGQTGM